MTCTKKEKKKPQERLFRVTGTKSHKYQDQIELSQVCLRGQKHKGIITLLEMVAC